MKLRNVLCILLLLLALFLAGCKDTPDDQPDTPDDPPVVEGPYKDKTHQSGTYKVEFALHRLSCGR